MLPGTYSSQAWYARTSQQLPRPGLCNFTSVPGASNGLVARVSAADLAKLRDAQAKTPTYLG